MGLLDDIRRALMGEFQQELMRAARKAAGPVRYGAKEISGQRGSILDQLLKLFTRTKGRGSDIEAAKRLLLEAGYQVTQRGTIEPLNRGGLGSGRIPPSQRFPSQSRQPGGRIGSLRGLGEPDPGTTPEGAPPLPGERGPAGYEQFPEILTPQSSNVFSFAFTREAKTRGTLYVTFKANEIHASVTAGPGRHGGRSHLRGMIGATVGNRTNERGSSYAYSDVPVIVYERMKRASSKGKFVWDELRVRGTIYGHRYTYQLVQGQIAAGTGGVYVPRKATQRGFSVRSLSDQGRGRRGFISSALPSQRGHATRRGGG